MQEPQQPNLIKQIRLRMGMTQQQFADMLGITQGNIGHYELRGQTMLPEGAKRLIREAAVRGHRVTYEDIYGVVDAKVLTPKEIEQRNKRHAEN